MTRARGSGETIATEPVDVPALRIGLLGGFSIEVGGRTVPDSAWRLRRAKDVVKAARALGPPPPAPGAGDGDLWPERPLDAQANNLHQALHAARRAIGGGADEALRPRAGLLQLAPGLDLWIDLEAYEATARDPRETGDPARYEEARSIYRGPLLPDDRFEEWAERRRDALEQDRLSLLWELAGLRAAAGDHAAATVQADPPDRVRGRADRLRALRDDQLPDAQGHGRLDGEPDARAAHAGGGGSRARRDGQHDAVR